MYSRIMLDKDLFVYWMQLAVVGHSDFPAVDNAVDSKLK